MKQRITLQRNINSCCCCRLAKNNLKNISPEWRRWKNEKNWSLLQLFVINDYNAFRVFDCGVWKSKNLHNMQQKYINFHDKHREIPIWQSMRFPLWRKIQSIFWDEYRTNSYCSIAFLFYNFPNNYGLDLRYFSSRNWNNNKLGIFARNAKFDA